MSPSTALHSRRVARFARLTAYKMGLSKAEIGSLNSAALLHDIGKMALSESIVQKRGPLDLAEITQMRQHPAVAADFLRMLGLSGDIIEIVENHHERYDGLGYPYGLKGSEIPLGARIIAVADAYDAMTSIRPYHMSISADSAMEELERYAGAQWDHQIVSNFTSIIGTWKYYGNVGSSTFG